MQKCQSCGAETGQATPFCAACGKPLADEAVEIYSPDTPTLQSVPRQPTPRKPSSRPSSHSYANEGRFAPGALVAGRYRIVALLGRGGMGEVYRADDLSLGQQIALKFLPEFARSEETLERFRNEVRIARRISHPNVCRVFDIGEADELIFFTMEYIDGEDLASLLRRIGRLPGDKAAEIARKICAGVAAAHDKGVLHRDLKPANVMLDGRGEVLITEPARMERSDESSGKKVGNAVLAVLALLLLFAAVLIAWRNYTREKAHVEGAWRLGIVIFALQMLLWFFRAHFVPSISSLGLFVLAASSSLSVAAVVCALYLAIEPYVRRHWPHAIISWSRLMAGQLRDPLVGRDMLYGVLLGVGWALIYSIFFLLRLRAGDAPALGTTDYLLGARHVLGSWLWHLAVSVQGTLLFFFVMFLLRVILRKPWLAALAFVAVWTAIKTAGSHHVLIDVTTFAAIYAIAAFVVLRFGFIALATGMFTVDLLLNIPISTNLSSWYMGGSVFVLLTVTGLAVWGCHSAYERPHLKPLAG